MAEHLRNQLARASAPVRPHRILTLAKFLQPFTPFEEAPESLLNLLIARANLSTLGAAAEFPGFHRALASLIQEVPENFPGIADEIEGQLAIRGRALRPKLLHTADPIATGPIVFDGFFTFGPAELDLIETLAAQTSVTVTLPDWPGSSAARTRLLQGCFIEQRLDAQLRQPLRTVFAAPSLEREIEQIALRILEHAAQGREFREMGILLRVRNPYAGALETALARFGIPARFHFADPVSSHPAIQFLSGIIRGRDLLTFLRMPISGLGATPSGDKLDFEMREEALPVASLDYFHSSRFPVGRPILAAAGFEPAFFEFLKNRLTPADWAANLKTLRQLIPTPEITDQVDQTQLQIWRSTAAALEAFANALDTTALAFNHSQKISLSSFWPNVETVLSIDKLRVPDRRRNVVNVLDVYEARQWELPIVFVCGLKYHRESEPEEEKFLFDLATTRATEKLILSYPLYNEKGDPTLRSFFLESEAPPRTLPRVLPRRVGQGHAPSPILAAPDVKQTTLSPSSIESFLQCPYQFFARKTLHLRERPAKPRDRLDALLQGTILHEALARGEFDQVFAEKCREANIPVTYRTEAVRLELLRHYEAFLADRQWPFTWPSLTEQKFKVVLTPELSISGRIDRLDTGPHNQALVIDYKYSAGAKIRQLKANADGNLVQGGLYLLAAERAFGLEPAGMFFCGLRQSVTWEGWHANIPGLALGESRTPSGLRELIAAAEEKAIETFEQILAGNRDVRPSDPTKCRWCDFRDICRKESLPRVTAATGADE